MKTWMGQNSMVIVFFNDTATTEIYTLSLHDALPIFYDDAGTLQHIGVAASFTMKRRGELVEELAPYRADALSGQDRKSTRLNSSHANISYAVFCLKKKH